MKTAPSLGNSYPHKLIKGILEYDTYYRYVGVKNKEAKSPMSLAYIAVFISEVGVVLSALIPITIWIRKIVEGQKCQLRSDMLRIYYRHYEYKSIRQYEYENFVALYEAYKALKGNSFIDKIYSEIKTWKVIT